MTLDPNKLLVKSQSLTTQEQARHYVRTIEPGSPTNLADPYIQEVFRLYPEAGYSPEVVIAQWAVETGAGTSEYWQERLNPAGIGVTDGGDFGYEWKTPAAAAQGQVVHLSGYVDGYNRGLRKYLSQDPRYLLLLGTDYAQSVKSVADLTGKWATDPEYGDKIAWRIEGMRNTVIGGNPNPGPVLPPPLVWEGTNNYGVRAKGQLPLFVVHHITDDMVYDHVKGWFQNPASEASSNFVIDRDGTIYQFVSTLNYAWTNGDFYTNGRDPRGTRVARRDIPRLNDAIEQVYTRGWNLNGFSISIEYVGTPDNPPTEKQYLAGIALTKYFLATYPSLSPHRFGQLRHADINPASRPYCPGPKFNLTRIIEAVGGDPKRLS